MQCYLLTQGVVSVCVHRMAVETTVPADRVLFVTEVSDEGLDGG